MKYNLLIAEDHPLTRDTLAYQIKKIDFVNLAGKVENGKEAVEFVLNNKPDIVLMDIDMPIMNGIEATTEIKKQNPKTIIIIPVGR